MATSGSSSVQFDSPPHGKTKVIAKYTAVDHGPLNDLGRYYDDFRGASYHLTTPASNDLVLYRWYGGEAREDGQYWSAEKREGNLSYALDNAILPQWQNAQNKLATLYVPPGIYLFEGYAAPQHPHAEYGRRDYGYLGGGWQIFIPQRVVTPLLQAQKALLEGKREDIDKYVKEAFSAQHSYVEKFNKRTLNDFCSDKNAKTFLRTGNALRRLPEHVRKSLQSETSVTSTTSGSNTETIPTGSYVVHCEEVQLLGGRSVSVSLHVRTEFSHETVRTYQSGKTRITEITRHYKRIMEWK